MYSVLVMTIKKRKETAIRLQEILSDFGDIIKTRLGLHETTQETHEGLIILHLANSPKTTSLMKKLNAEKDITAELVKIK